MDSFFTFWLVIALVALLVHLVMRRSNRSSLQQEVADLRSEVARQAELIREVTQRLYHLESRGAPAPVMEAPAAPEPVPSPVPSSTMETVTTAEEPPPLPIPAPAPGEPLGPSWGEQLRERYQGEEWEALVGGSLLNKLGALMLVIGVALFLGYTLTHLGPAGKVAVGFGISLSMLLSGVLLERKQRYKIFARGFIGGGWALLYFVTYAMYGLPAAQVIGSPALGFVLLLAVAAGMVLHSLAYQSEVITGLTFFIAFITITLFPSSNYALAASVVLAAFLLAVAESFQWTTVVVAGLIFTYGAHLVQFDLRGDPKPEAWAGQAALWLYWLLFEGFDLLRARRQPEDRGVLRTILPLNACGFIGLALLPNSPVSAESLGTFLAVAAVAFLGSAVLRAGSLRGEESDETKPVWVALLSGGYESAITITAALMVGALVRKYSGTALKIALLMEGELLVLGGLTLGRRYLRQLGAVVLSLGLVKILAVDLPHGGTRTFLGRTVQFWTPSAIAVSLVYYLNRFITRSTVFYTWGAAALIGVVIGFEVPLAYRGVSWMLYGTLLLACTLWTKWRETPWQAALLLPIGYATAFFVVVDSSKRDALWAGGLGTILAALVTALVFRQGRLARLPSAATVLLAMAWIVRAAPERGIGLGWAAVVAILVELGLLLPWAWLRQMAWGVGFATVLAAIYAFGLTDQPWVGLPFRLVVGLPIAALMYYSAQRTARIDAPWSKLYQYLGTITALAMLGWQAGEHWGAAAWSGLALALLGAGLWRADQHLRLQAYAVAFLSFCWSLGTVWDEPQRVWRTVPVIATLYAMQLLIREYSERWDQAARPAVSVAATLLLGVLLYFQISGERLTVAWGIEGVLLLVAGFLLRERVLRVSGLAVFLLCISKLFLYDLRRLETMSRILSFIVLGLLLLGASWIYTRFRDQVRKLL